MLRRFSSIDWKFPALMSGIVILITAILLRLAYVQFTGVLYEASGAQMRTSSSMVANLLALGADGRRNQINRVASDPAVIRFLRSGADRAAALAVIVRAQGPVPDSARSRFQLISPSGETRLDVRPGAATAFPQWATEAAARGVLSGATDVEFSPILDGQGLPYFQVVAAVTASTLASATTPMRGPVEMRRDSVIGFVVETRALFGRTLTALKDLGGAGTVLIGSDGGVWTDFDRIRPGPPPIVRSDSAFRFAESPGGRGLGFAQPVAGTPWIVWLQRSHGQVVAPVRDFVARATVPTTVVALVGVLLAWVFGRRIRQRIVLLTRQIDQLEADPSSPTAAAERHTDEIEHLEHAFTRMASRVETQQQLEMQQMQSQKLEAIGRLAGGIAHDFNNVLTVVTNYGEMVQAELIPGSTPARDMDEVLRAAERAAGLTRQLLAFSRQQIISPQRLALNEVIGTAHRMLTRLIPSNIEIVTELDPHTSAINADPGQIDQVLFNLILNAADAMPKGGVITIRTLMADLDDTFAPVEGEAHPGRHVCLVVRDNGVGMDRETKERIFEPFFTTKPLGQGTGLGLPTVHGIVTQSGGRVWVYSEPGLGTTFKLFFPAMGGVGEPVPSPTPTLGPTAPDRGTILLVEDDPATREVARRLLARQGFNVLQAERGAEALATLDREAERVDLVLTDVMMPGMSGVDLAETIAARWPNLPVLLMSGYSDAEIRDKGKLGRELALVEKPFTSAALLEAIRHTMSAAR